MPQGANLTAVITFLMGIISLVALVNDNLNAFTAFLTLTAIGTVILHILFNSKSQTTSNQRNNEEF